MRQFYFGILLPVLASLSKECDSLADGAVYIIQNSETKRCLSAGPIIQYEDSANKTLFKDGLAIPKQCSTTTNVTDMDFGQQWLIQIKKLNPRKYFYQVQLVMTNIQYVDHQLKVQLRGEFVSYLPDVILLGHQFINESKQSIEYQIMDAKTHYCLADESERIRFLKCSHSLEDKFKLWDFILINEVEATKPETKNDSQVHEPTTTL